MEMRNNKKIAIKLIKDEFNFLNDLGYKSSVTEEKRKIFMVNLKVRYVNDKINREIIIGYTKIIINGNIKYSFQLKIVRRPFQNPRRDYFSQSIYLRSLGKELKSSMINDFIIEEAIKILREISSYLKSHSKSIINGDEWIEGFYPHW